MIRTWIIFSLGLVVGVAAGVQMTGTSTPVVYAMLHIVNMCGCLVWLSYFRKRGA